MDISTKEKGDIAVADAIAYYTRKNVQVLLPFGDKQKYDLAKDTESGLKKVQCKHCNNQKESGSFEVPLRVCGGNRSRHKNYKYQIGDFDFMYVLTGNNERYELPASAIIGKSSVTVGKKYREYLIT